MNNVIIQTARVAHSMKTALEQNSLSGY